MNLHNFARGTTVWNTHPAQPMYESTMRARAPSIFAESAASDVSGRYLFLPTWEILTKLMAETGLIITKVEEQKCRTRDGAFAKHEVTLRLPSTPSNWKVGDTVFECRLTNSHDRSSAYSITPGLYRYACSNGLLVPDSMLPGVHVRHTGDKAVVSEIIEGTCRVLTDAPQLQDQIETMRSTQLSVQEQRAFASAASLLRWDEGKAPVRPEVLLNARRHADVGSDQWIVLNRVQEALIAGGGVDYKRSPGCRAKRSTVRALASITENQRINKALFTLVREMGRIRAAA